MSEYQYYEFRALDRPLTRDEMRELRSRSSRARITSTSFVNEYAWGSFKGDEDAWMEKYLDAFVYVADWGTRVLKLRLPAGVLSLGTARKYRAGTSLSARDASGRVVLSFGRDDEEADEPAEGEGVLSSLVPLRAELARGDLRALYLGWLLGAQAGELRDDKPEPPVPPGLGQLSDSLQSLAEFLRLDEDLLEVAAEASPPLEEARLAYADVRAWVASLPASEKDDVLAGLLTEGDQSRLEELLQRFLRARDRLAGKSQGQPSSRTAGELLRAASARAEERRRREAEERVLAEARRQAEAAAARATYLEGLAGREPKVWAEVSGLIATRQPVKYDQAVQLLVDLRDLDRREPCGNFRMRLQELRQKHASKPTLLKRLRDAGL